MDLKVRLIIGYGYPFYYKLLLNKYSALLGDLTLKEEEILSELKNVINYIDIYE